VDDDDKLTVIRMPTAQRAVDRPFQTVFSES
jgi:hypothetical protein